MASSMRAKLGLAPRIVGLLPGAGPLEGDVGCPQNLAQPPSADPPRPLGAVAQLRGQVAQAPTVERQPQRLRARRRRLDDEILVLSRDPTGTATRPLRDQRGYPQLAEPLDHLTHPVLRRHRQPRERRHRVAASGRQHHQRPPPPNRRPPLNRCRPGERSAEAHDPPDPRDTIATAASRPVIATSFRPEIVNRGTPLCRLNQATVSAEQWPRPEIAACDWVVLLSKTKIR